MNKKTIIKSIKNHSIGQPDLCGSHYLWGFTKEVNNQVYSLKKDYGFDVPETSSKGKEVDLSTHNFISVLKNNFLSKNPKNGVYLPKPERHFQFSLTNFLYYLEKYFWSLRFQIRRELGWWWNLSLQCDWEWDQRLLNLVYFWLHESEIQKWWTYL